LITAAVAAGAGSAQADQDTTAQALSQRVVEAALSARTPDNATALVLRVRGLAGWQLADTRVGATQLPVPPRLTVGDVLDGYTITAVVADTGVHRLYQARDAATRELVAIKTLHESRASDTQEREMLAHEAWLGLRVGEQGGAGSQGFVRVREQRAASAFYTVFDWHSGRTLEQLLETPADIVPGETAGRAPAPLDVAEVVRAGLAASKAIGRLHRLGVIHRDIKPGNLHLGEDGQWRLLDLGVAVSGREPEAVRALHAGTPSYMNPEQWEGDHGQPAHAGSDLFALGVTLYQWLAGRLPYGEIEPWQTARYRRDPIAPSRLRPVVPIWLDHVVLKAVARDPLLRPGAGPADLHHAQQPHQHGQGQRREGDEAPQVGAGVLLGQAHGVGHQAAAQGADLADHRAGHGGGQRPAQRHQLEQRAVARAQRGKAQHEQQVVTRSESSARPHSTSSRPPATSTPVRVLTPPQRSETVAAHHAQPSP
jgi:hypothetical protein